MQLDHTEKRVKKQGWRRGLKSAGVVAAALVIYVLGVNVGQGNIVFGTMPDQNKALPADLDYASVERLYDSLRANYDGTLDANKLLDGLKTGLAEATGDPYTVYLNQKDAEDFNKQLSGTFSGIGAELGKDSGGNLVIVAPIAGFPAAKAGLRPQDIVVAINGKSAAGLSVEEAVTKIRGPKGTEVKLRVLRDKKEDLNFTIIRQDIKIPSVKHEILDGSIGYMQINQFSDDTAQLAQAAAQEFKAKKVRGVVLDLRGNPGGLLDASVEVASLWLPKGQVVLQEKQSGIVAATFTADGNDTLRGLPTAVLINEGSASASEILAGALKDHGVATLFGVKSYGKGSVQQIQKLRGGSALKVTIARWFRPNGQNIDGKGIAPDHEVKMTEDDYKNARDPQKEAALDFIKS